MKTFEDFIETYNFPKHFTETTINAMKIIAKDAWEASRADNKTLDSNYVNKIHNNWDLYKKKVENEHKDFINKFSHIINSNIS